MAISHKCEKFNDERFVSIRSIHVVPSLSPLLLFSAGCKKSFESRPNQYRRSKASIPLQIDNRIAGTLSSA